MLGTINGVAASTASLSGAFGPTVSGFLFSVGLRCGYGGLAWWCSALIAVGGAVISLRMTYAESLSLSSSTSEQSINQRLYESTFRIRLCTSSFNSPRSHSIFSSGGYLYNNFFTNPSLPLRNITPSRPQLLDGFSMITITSPSLPQ